MTETDRKVDNWRLLKDMVRMRKFANFATSNSENNESSDGERVMEEENSLNDGRRKSTKNSNEGNYKDKSINGGGKNNRINKEGESKNDKNNNKYSISRTRKGSFLSTPLSITRQFAFNSPLLLRKPRISCEMTSEEFPRKLSDQPVRRKSSGDHTSGRFGGQPNEWDEKRKEDTVFKRSRSYIVRSRRNTIASSKKDVIPKLRTIEDFRCDEELLNNSNDHLRIQNNETLSTELFLEEMLRLRKQHPVNNEDEKIPQVRVTSDQMSSDSEGSDDAIFDRSSSPSFYDQDIFPGETAEDAEMRKQALQSRSRNRRRSSVVQIPTASIQMDLHTIYMESINANNNNKTKKGKSLEERKLQRNGAVYGSFEGGEFPCKPDNERKGRFSLLKKFKKDCTLEEFRDFLEYLRSNLTEVSDHELSKYKDAHWSNLGKFDDDDYCEKTSALLNTKLSDQERKRFEALWELLYAEISYLINNLIVLHDVFSKPLEHAKSFGFLSAVNEETIFHNLLKLIEATSDFAKSLLKMFKERGTSVSRSTEIIVGAFKMFDKKLTLEYDQYSLNYQRAIAHLETLKDDEIFQEFIKCCEQDTRCKRRHLKDLLVAPLQHLTKYPLLLKAIRKHSPQGDRYSGQLTKTIIDIEESIKSVEKKISSLMNLQRLQEIQDLVVWPVFGEVDKKTEIPDFVRNDLNNNHNVTVLMNPNRQLLQEGLLTLADKDKTEFYLFLFDDMLLMTKPKKKIKSQRKNTGPEEKSSTESPVNRQAKKQSMFDQPNSSQNQCVVHKQPLPVDRLKIYDCDDQASASGYKNSFCLVNFNRYHQAVGAYTFQASTPEEKTTWLKNLNKAKDDATSEGFSSAKDISSDEEYML